MESIREKVIGHDIQDGGTQMTGDVEPTLETKNQIEERQTTIERIKDVSLTEEVSQDIKLTYRDLLLFLLSVWKVSVYDIFTC